jgi:hypothetical protein
LFHTRTQRARSGSKCRKQKKREQRHHSMAKAIVAKQKREICVRVCNAIPLQSASSLTNSISSLGLSLPNRAHKPATIRTHIKKKTSVGVSQLWSSACLFVCYTVCAHSVATTKLISFVYRSLLHFFLKLISLFRSRRKKQSFTCCTHAKAPAPKASSQIINRRES